MSTGSSTMNDVASGSAGASGSAELALAVYSGPPTAWFCGGWGYHRGGYHRSTVGDLRRFWEPWAISVGVIRTLEMEGSPEQSADLRPLGLARGGVASRRPRGVLGALQVAALEVFWRREVLALAKSTAETEVKLLEKLTEVFGFEPPDRHFWRGVGWAPEVGFNLPDVASWLDWKIRRLREWLDGIRRSQDAFEVGLDLQLPLVDFHSLDLWSESLDGAVDDAIASWRA